MIGGKKPCINTELNACKWNEIYTRFGELPRVCGRYQKSELQAHPGRECKCILISVVQSAFRLQVVFTTPKCRHFSGEHLQHYFYLLVSLGSQSLKTTEQMNLEIITLSSISLFN